LLFSLVKNFWQKFSGVEKKLLLFFALLLAASYSVLIIDDLQHGKTVPKIAGSYTEGLVGQPLLINPLLASTDVDMDLARVVYAGLLKFDPNLNLVPDLAENLPQISPDGKSYTIKLKDNLYWHDGNEFTADDLVFTYKAIQNQELRSPLRLSWNRVEVTKIDSRTIKLTTRESSATFIANLTVGILPKHIWETVPAESFALSKFNLEPIGSGPFRVSGLQRGRNGEIKEIRLVRFERYHGEGPYLKNLDFKFFTTSDRLIGAYHSRDITGLGYVPFDQSLFIEPKANLQQIFLTLPQYQTVFINRAKNPAPLEDRRVRLALAKSVDKNKIIKEVYGGQASESYGPILPGYLGFDDEIIKADMNVYDPERAKALLEEAGWIMDSETGFRKDKLNRTLSLSLATNDFSPNVRVAQSLKEMWEGIGIQIVLSIETIADLKDKFISPRNYELILFSENVGVDPDPYPFWHSSQLRDPGLNLSTFSNKTADKLLVEARTNIPPPERVSKYKQFQNLFADDVPAIFLNRYVFVYNIPQALKGVKLNTIFTPSERFADINKWYLGTKRVKK
jgi:peptide/nickel transport system substrate-binding protein